MNTLRNSLAAGVVAAISLGAMAEVPEPRELQQSTRINALSAEMLAARIGEDGLANAMVSSVSLFYALAQLESGAAGSTAALISDLLLADGELDVVAPALADALLYAPQDPEATVGSFVMANSVWATNGGTDGQPFVFSESYLKDVAEDFATKPYSVDFKAESASDGPNSWASENTDGLIPEVIDDDTMNPLAWLILNAAYFEGSWEKSMALMPAGDDYEFELLSGESLPAASVKTTIATQVFDAEDGSVAFAVPFAGRRYAMVFHVPPEAEPDVTSWLRGVAVPDQAQTVAAALSNDVIDGLVETGFTP